MKLDVEQLLKNLDIKYNDLKIYKLALTHSSYGNENFVENNERLEFLGDAVIELLMSEYLYENTNYLEGEMTIRRAQAVREEALIIYGQDINLVNFLFLGKGEIQKGLISDGIVADALEALFAACYLDAGLKETKKMFNKIILPNLEKTSNILNYKSKLQETIQSGIKRNLSYQITKEIGMPHNKYFEAIVILDKDIILGKGSGKTKKEAEQKAAEDALRKGIYVTKDFIWKLWV